MSQIIWVYRKGAKLVAQLHRHLHLKRWKTLYIRSYLCSISICKTDAHCKTNWIWHFTGFHLHYNKKAAIQNKCNIHFVIPRILLLLLFVTSILCVVISNKVIQQSRFWLYCRHTKHSFSRPLALSNDVTRKSFLIKEFFRPRVLIPICNVIVLIVKILCRYFIPHFSDLRIQLRHSSCLLFIFIMFKYREY